MGKKKNYEFTLPLGVKDETRLYMEEVFKKLEADGLIETVDNAALQMLARNYNTFLIAMDTVDREGVTVRSDRGNIAEHPAVKIARDAQLNALKMMKEFGLTSLSRKKLGNQKDDEEENPFGAFVKK